jgi:ferredoxin/coenzyme F420-reducing hydrogenase delta subunit
MTMNISVHRPIRWVFDTIEAALDRPFGHTVNPMRHLGALGFFMYWIVAATGIYLYIFFDTGTTAAYLSVEYMTNDQWYLAGVMRSLHRYASDFMVAFMVVHLLREFARDRYRGVRWFSWVSGTPVVVLLFVSGITGYWLVWDKLAQFIAVRTTEWFDWLPVFVTPVAGNFLTPETLDDRFFSLMIFIHIAAPLLLLLFLWIHLQRVSRPRINPPRGLAVGMFAVMIVVSLVHPATSQAPADLATVPAAVNLDWFYLGLYPLMDAWSSGPVWAAVVLAGATFVLIPWMPPMRRAPVAEVHLDHCNGCGRCADDCPYGAVTMQPRTDGAKFDLQAVVDPDLCVSCGICVGACPSSTPFRRRGAIATGIELPHLTLEALHGAVHEASQSLSGEGRVIVVGCENTVRMEHARSSSSALVSVPCTGMLPPAFVDYILTRGLADGVVVAGCALTDCHNRFGNTWTEARIERSRDPTLRERVPRDRIERIWLGRADHHVLTRLIARFSARVAALAGSARPHKRTPADKRVALEGADHE